MKNTRNPQRVRSDDGMVIPIPLFADLPWLVHGFTTRHGGVSTFAKLNPRRRSNLHCGDLNLGRVAWESNRNVLENRRRLLAHLKAEKMKLITLRQIHSDLIRMVDADIPEVGDGLITNRTGVLLSILSADCFPILLADTRLRVVAALHCGWRGTARRMVEKGVGRMRMIYGSRPQDLRAAIGPGIRVCCYKVGAEVIEEFGGQFHYAESIQVKRNDDLTPLQAKYTRLFKTYKSLDEPPVNPQAYLDLVQANVRQLRDAGISQNRIYAEAPCTSCHPELFFSHRRDDGRTGRMMGVIGIRER